MLPILVVSVPFIAAFLVALEVTLTRRWVARWEARDITPVREFSTWRLLRFTGTLSIGVLTALVYFSPMAGAVTALIAWLFIVSIATDLRTMKIPREAAWTVLLLGASLAGLDSLVTSSYAGLASFGVALAVVGSVMLATALLTRGALGSGDVRIMLAATPLAAWNGYESILMGIAFGGILQLALRPLLTKLKTSKAISVNGMSRTAYPFVPALALGLIVAVLMFGGPGTAVAEWLNAF